jgi:hypothetical protein
MARLAPRVPETTDLLCEACGYVLKGLPDTGRCPECGTPIADSIGNHRQPPAWELAQRGGFLRTTAQVLFHPTHFYRTLAVRGPVPPAHRFARVHWWISAALFATAAFLHGALYWPEIVQFIRPAEKWRFIATASAGLCILFVATYLTYLMLDGLTRLAARLTNWEARYRGYRLPYDVVLRGMYYHAAHYVPVALGASATVIGYFTLVFVVGWSVNFTIDRYTYVLCAEVVLFAAYLFYTYWIGMRNMMYANR